MKLRVEPDLSPRNPTVEGECLPPVDGHHGVVQVGVLEAGLCFQKTL